MKVVLLKNVGDVGSRGQVIEIRDPLGVHLQASGLALAATPVNIERVRSSEAALESDPQSGGGTDKRKG